MEKKKLLNKMNKVIKYVMIKKNNIGLYLQYNMY